MTRRPTFPARIDFSQGQPAPARKAGVMATEVPRRGAVERIPLGPQGLGMDSAAVRASMVQKLAAQGVADPAVLRAMNAVERHRFVEPALVNQAYEDTSLPIGLGQTISKPNVVARMIELLRHGVPGKMGRVLEIGTGCGYQAAVLCQLATEVYSIERLRGLHDKARENLRPCGWPMCTCCSATAWPGLPRGRRMPPSLRRRAARRFRRPGWISWRMGGRLVAPMVTATGQQALVVIDKTSDGLKQTVLEAVHFVPLKSGIA